MTLCFDQSETDGPADGLAAPGNVEGQSMPPGSPRYSRVVITVAVGIGLSLACAVIAWKWEQAKARMRLERDAEEHVAAIQCAVHCNVQMLDSLGAFYDAGGSVTREEFSIFTTSLLSHSSAIQALEWIPRVADSERAAFEQAARRDGLDDFQIADRRSQGRMVPSGRRDEYFPVFYVEPPEGNEIAIGFDLASNPVRLEALLKSRDSGQMLATEPITLVQETGAQNGLLIFRPVYRAGAALDTVESRRHNLVGFVAGAFRIGDMLQNALVESKLEGLDVQVYFGDNSAGGQLLAAYVSSMQRVQRVAPPRTSRPGPCVTSTVELPGQTWSVILAAGQGYRWQAQARNAWAVLGIGLAVTVLLSTCLVIAISRAARIRSLAGELTIQSIEREQVEVALGLSNRAVRMFTECNQAIVRAERESALLAEVCRVLVEVGGYRMAWVGYAEQDAARTVRPVAWAGFEAGYFESADITWDNSPRGHGPTGTAIRTGRVFVNPSFRDNPGTAGIGPWRDEALKRGYGSSVALPLLADGRAFGALTIYSADADVFDAGKIEVLSRLAEELAFAIQALRSREQQQWAEQALRASEEQYRELVEHANSAIVKLDRQGRIVFFNEFAEKFFGFRKEEVVGRHVVGTIVPETESTGRDLREMMDRIAADPDAFGTNVNENVTRDGRRVWVAWTNRSIRDSDGRVIGTLGVGVDITERKRAEELLQSQCDLAMSLGSAQDLSRALAVLLDAVCRIQGVDCGGVHLVNEQTGELALAAHRGLTPGFVQAVSHYGPDSWRTNLVAQGQPRYHRYRDLAQDAAETELQEGLRALAVLPIRYERGVVAALNVASHTLDEIPPATRNLLEAIAAQAGATIARVQAEQALRDEVQAKQQAVEQARGLQQQIEFILGATRTGLDIIDGQFNLRYVDPKWQEVYGDPTGRKCHEYFMGCPTPCPGCAVPRALQTREQTVSEEILVRESNRPVQVTTIPFQTAAGEWLVAEVNVDITERKRAEEELRSIAQFPDENPHPVLRISRDGVVLYANKATADLLEQWGCQVGQKVPGALAQTVLDVLATGDSRMLDIEQNQRTYSFVLAPVASQGYVNLYGRDITEQKRLEQAVHDSEQRYRRLTGAVTDYIYTVTVADGRAARTVHGPGCVAVTGYSTEEFAADPHLWIRMVPEADRPDVLKQAEQVLAGQDAGPLEHRIVRKDGTTRWVRSTPVLQRDEQRRVVAYDGLIQDVTDRKAAEEQLQYAYRVQTIVNGLLHLSLKNLPLEGILDEFLERMTTIPFISLAPKGAIFLADPGSGDLVLASHKGLAEPLQNMCARVPPGRCLCGRAAATGKVVFASCVGEEHENRYEGISPHGHYCLPLLSADRRVLGVMNLYVQAGHRRDEQEEAVLRAMAGVLAGVIGRKQLEEQFRQSQKMEAVGQLAGGVAHDFNNILTGITGFAQLALEDIPADHPVGESLTEVCRLADRASRLTNQLLAFSRRQNLEPVVLNLNTAVQNVSRMFRPLISEAIDLRLDCAADLPNVRVDPTQIEQVLMNLVVNGRDAMPDGGALTVTTRTVRPGEPDFPGHPDGVQPVPHVVLSVADTGCGMDEATKARLFEPFFTTKGPGSGTGLGLSTVYGIVRQHGGHITIASELGKGTTAMVYLPAVDEPVFEPAAGAESASPEGGAETILLVEDEPAVRNMVRQILVRQGYTVLEAEDPAAAQRLFAEQGDRVDLVLTDVIMPQMNGRQLYEKLAADRPGLKVLYMSGYTADAIAHHGVLDAGTWFLPKPFSPAALADKVRQALDQRPASREDRPVCLQEVEGRVV